MYKGKSPVEMWVAVQTQIEFDTLVRIAYHDLGLIWPSGSAKDNFWETYKGRTVVLISNKYLLTYASTQFCRDKGEEVTSFNEAMRIIAALTDKPLPTIPMSTSIVDFFKNMTASADEKLLKEFGIEEPIGTPTTVGLELSARINYQANRAAIIKVAQDMKAEQDAAKKV